MKALGWLLLSVFLCPVGSHASEVFLLPVPSDPSGLAMELLDSRRPIGVSRVEISSSLTVLIDMEGISPPRWERVKVAIAALGAARTPPFRLSILSDGSIRTLEWKTPAQLIKQLNGLAPTSGEGAQEWIGARNILASLPEITETWESLLVISEPRSLRNTALRTYLESVASHTIRAKRLRLFYWGVTIDMATRTQGTSDTYRNTTASDEDARTIWGSVSAATCGAVLPSADTPSLWIERLNRADCKEVTMEPPLVPFGFVPYAASLVSASDSMKLTGLLTGPSWTPASFDKYSELLDLFADAQSGFENKQFDASRISLQRVLEINPLHVPALLLAGEIYEQQKDWATALRLLEPLSVLFPRDGELSRRLGNIAYELKDWDRSQKYYSAQLERTQDDHLVLERLSLIREQIGDLSGAIAYIARVLQLEPNKLPAQLRQAKLLDMLDRPNESSASYEKVLALDPGLDEVRIRLIEIYRTQGNAARRTELLNARIGSVENSLALRMKYAELSEQADLPESALKFYSLALETDPAYEPAHFGRTRILLASGNLNASFAAAEAGLEAAPSSVRLLLSKVDILGREGRIFDRKNAIHHAAEIAPGDEAVLRLLADAADVFGDNAGNAYQRWADALSAAAVQEEAMKQALERGIVVSLRDGDRESAVEMSRKLEKLGDSHFARLDATPPPTASVVRVPGGIKGLTRAAQISPSTPPARVAAEYARALIGKPRPIDAGRLFDDRLKLYFEIVRALKLLGQPIDGGTEIQLDLASNQGASRASRVLGLLGWEVRKSSRNAVTVELKSGAENGAHQEFVSVLGIDEVEMKQRLEQQGAFAIRLLDESVPVILDESFLLGIATNKEGQRRGLIEEMLYNEPLARLYVGLSTMNLETRNVVIQAIEPEQLLKRAAALSFYGASVSIKNGRLVLPGGDDAAAAWTTLVGAKPDEIGQFAGNLMRRDGGKLLAYFHTLAALPLANQRFFTKTTQRLSAFYKAFPFEDETALDSGVFLRRDDPFGRLARELPLDAEGNVKFPGSERVWMVANGGSGSAADVEKLVRRAGQINSPDLEDEILLDMLKRKNEAVLGGKYSQIENFLAVARIDAHRKAPMDEVMALTFAQNHARYQSTFPYFAELPSLTGQQTTAFFQAAARLERFEGVELNTALGEFHGLVKLLLLLHEVRAIPEPKAVEFFALICSHFSQVQAYRDIPFASFDLLEAILRDIGDGANDSVEDLLIRSLAGSSSPREFLFDGATRSVNLADTNAKRIRSVLQLQSITSLDALLQTYRAALALTKTPSAGLLVQIEANLGKFTELKPGAGEKLSGDTAERLLIARPEELSEIVIKLKKELDKKKQSPENVSRLAKTLIGELNPFLKTSLVGWIYAYYSSPTDLAVANNKYLVRSHSFYSIPRKEYWPETRIEQSDVGAHLIGGLAQIGAGIGTIGTAKVESSQTMIQTAAVSMQLAAVRSIPWSQVGERSAHMVALRIKLGREFVVHAAFDEALRKNLERATLGSIGLSRRFELLDSLDAFDIHHAMSLLTASDLFFLADAFLSAPESRKFASAVTSAYETESRIVPPEQANYFGGFHAVTNGCVHPHLTHLDPYEDYADLLLAEPIAERLSDILLHLSESVDRAGLPAQVLGLVAEDAVRQFSDKTRTTPKSDWIAEVDALRSIDVSESLRLLEKR